MAFLEGFYPAQSDVQMSGVGGAASLATSLRADVERLELRPRLKPLHHNIQKARFRKATKQAAEFYT